MKTFFCGIDKKFRLKLLSWLLIYCIVIEPSLMNMGCTSFYPSGGNNPADYKNTEKEILIIFKNKTELAVKTSRLYFVPKGSEFLYGRGEQFNYSNKRHTRFEGTIPPEKIDSEKVVKDGREIYQFIWLPDVRLIIEAENFYRVEPDNQNDYWAYVNPENGTVKQIYLNDIQAIEIRELDWLKTWLLIGLSLGVLALFIILLSSASGTSHSGGSTDCNSHSYSGDCRGGYY